MMMRRTRSRRRKKRSSGRTSRKTMRKMKNGEDKEKKEGWERGKGEVKGVSRRRKWNWEEE